jgi:hypothetical protein
MAIIGSDPYYGFESRSLRQRSSETVLRCSELRTRTRCWGYPGRQALYFRDRRLARKRSPPAHFFSRALYFWPELRFLRTPKTSAFHTIFWEVDFERQSLGEFGHQIDVCWFESWRPSQPVWSPGGVSRSHEFVRHYGQLARRSAVSAAQFLGCLATTAQFHAPVSGRHFSISVF